VGEQTLLPSPEGALVWRRARVGDVRVVAVNFTAEEQSVALEGSWRVEVASDGAGEGGRFPGRLGPDQAVVLEPGVEPRGKRPTP
jgi:alpha-glucosidase